MRVESFAEIAEEFHARIARIAWATVATVGVDGAPRTRILHPIWEDHVGWIATTANSLEIRHFAHESRVSLTYWDAEQDNVHVEAVATVARRTKPTGTGSGICSPPPSRRWATTRPPFGRARTTRSSRCCVSSPPGSS